MDIIAVDGQVYVTELRAHVVCDKRATVYVVREDEGIGADARLGMPKHVISHQPVSVRCEVHIEDLWSAFTGLHLF